ncbi:MAG: methyl-accepting chemotaxis protein [Gammaproteobacteria bacterium]|nr:methyl-accepting chemotaxis protein [Gammaproteobacteria bacterium]
MFSNIKIGSRLILLITVLTLIFVSVGTVTLVSLTDLVQDTSDLNNKVSESAEFTRLAVIVRESLVDVGGKLFLGNITWQQAVKTLESGQALFNKGWDDHIGDQAGHFGGDTHSEGLGKDAQEFFDDAFGVEVELVRQGFDSLLNIARKESRSELSLYMLNEASRNTSPFLLSADAFAALGSEEAQAIFDDAEEEGQTSLIIAAIVIIIGLVVAITLGPLIYVSITSPVKTISGVVERVSQGELSARTELVSQDEIGLLGKAFDNMLNERVSTLAEVESENERINNSVIALLEAVSDLSERDLTVRAPVAEDVTGPVADAMNLMASETANVLLEIRSVSGQVADASNRVQEQGGRVTQLAANERAIVEDTMTKLMEASKSMTQVAQLAKACNDTAAKASSSTQLALETVAKTATGMGDIRETIAETEKRIKRLGERSQEINGVVEIINNIAERTHVLALNASMQAAAAGDAGRGFAVVADEVQRLAESSRQSTSEIAGLVGNIQAETAETMATMNKTIAQVVDGTELAQAAGGQMEETQKTTSELAHSVEQILRRSILQAKATQVLRNLAAEVQTSTEETSKELEQQSNETVNLVEYAKRLVESVSVFKLPAA